MKQDFYCSACQAVVLRLQTKAGRQLFCLLFFNVTMTFGKCSAKRGTFNKVIDLLCIIYSIL